MNTSVENPAFCQICTKMTSTMAQLSAPKNAECTPNRPRKASAGPCCGLKMRIQSRPTTVTPSAMGRNTSIRPTAAARPDPDSRCASSRARAFCPMVTPSTKTSVASTPWSKPGAWLVNIAV